MNFFTNFFVILFTFFWAITGTSLSLDDNLAGLWRYEPYISVDPEKTPIDFTLYETDLWKDYKGQKCKVYLADGFSGPNKTVAAYLLKNPEDIGFNLLVFFSTTDKKPYLSEDGFFISRIEGESIVLGLAFWDVGKLTRLEPFPPIPAEPDIQL